jgi:hypothetical protein
MVHEPVRSPFVDGTRLHLDSRHFSMGTGWVGSDARLGSVPVG